MKIGLFGAFAFLLGCAGLYYLTQFSLVTSLSDTHRSGRSQREKSWLQEQREIMEKDGADSVAHTDLRSRQKKLRQRRKKLLAAAKRQASGRAAEQEDSTSHGHEEAAPDSSADALAQKQPIDGSNVRAAAAAATAFGDAVVAGLGGAGDPPATADGSFVLAPPALAPCQTWTDDRPGCEGLLPRVTLVVV